MSRRRIRPSSLNSQCSFPWVRIQVDFSTSNHSYSNLTEIRSSLKHQSSFMSRYRVSFAHFLVRNALISARPLKNSHRLRHSESSVYASATRSESLEFQASSAAFTLIRADSAVNGG